jgi:hypothetical protein
MNKLHSKITLITILGFIVFALSSCGWSAEPGDASDLAYKNDEITVSGLKDEDFTITATDLAKLDCVDKEVRTKNSWGNTETQQATGPLLTAFIAAYGREPSDFSEIRFIATDGYYADIVGDDIKDKRFVLSFRSGADPLTTENIPLRLLTPDDESSYWVSGVSEIEFTAAG